MFGSSGGMFEGSMFDGGLAGSVGLADDTEVQNLISMMQGRGNAVATATNSTALTAARNRLWQALQMAQERIAEGQGSATSTEFTNLQDTYRRKMYTYVSTANVMFWNEDATPTGTTTTATRTSSAGTTSAGAAAAGAANTKTGNTVLVPSTATSATAATGTRATSGIASLFGSMRTFYTILGLAAVGTGAYLYYKDKK